MSTIPFDFIVDKAALTVVATARYTARLTSVWDAFTKPEILDQWWGPKPIRSVTKEMNFEVGGRRLYTMRGPEGGGERWALQEFTSISPQTNFEMRTSFSDQDGNINQEFPSSRWIVNFSETAGVTTVSIRINYASLAVLERMVQMGFKEGFTMIMSQLQELLDRNTEGKE